MAEVRPPRDAPGEDGSGPHAGDDAGERREGQQRSGHAGASTGRDDDRQAAAQGAPDAAAGVSVTATAVGFEEDGTHAGQYGRERRSGRLLLTGPDGERPGQVGLGRVRVGWVQRGVQLLGVAGGVRRW